MGDDRRLLGQRGEAVAREALKRRGYRILEQNFRCPLGELDMVAREGKTLVFVEVKSDNDRSSVLPKDRVDSRKRKKLLQTAQFYLKQKRLHGVSSRFDVVQVIFREVGPPVVEIIPNAFEQSD